MDGTSGLVLSENAYNKLKWFSVICLPAIGAAYFALAPLWGLPKAEEVVGSLAIIGTLLGTLLGISSRNFNKSDNFDGKLESTGKGEGVGLDDLKFTLNKLPDDLLNKKVVRLKVDPNTAPGVPPE